MNRIEQVQDVVDEYLLNMPDVVERRCAYVHLYGVAQACAMLAKKRGENIELAIIIGMLHDISSYMTMDSTDHAHKSACMAESILKEIGEFTEEEIKIIREAIYYHSDKDMIHAPLDEVLKDADVMQHCLYNPLQPIKMQKKVRYEKLMIEFGIQ